MRVRTNDVRMDERRTFALAGVGYRPLHRLVAGEQIAAVHFLDVQVGEECAELADAAAGWFHLDGYRDGVAVVLDEVNDRQLEIAGVVERPPELAFARRAIAGRA